MARRSLITVFPMIGTLLAGSFGCQSNGPRDALRIREDTLEFRQRSTRRFQTRDENLMLAACAGVLQDLGFTIDDSETDLGFILASKDRTAVEGGQVAGKVFMSILLRSKVAIDRNQNFRVSIVTRPRRDGIAVRATFQRVVWNDRDQISKLEPIEEAGVYQEFFNRLSKAVFLEAHKL